MKDLINYCGYTPAHGYFGFANKNRISSWISCREQFHRVLTSKKCKNFIFSCAVDEKLKIINFINAINDKLGLSGNERCEIKDTNLYYALSVEVGEWWSYQPMRMSLLTILLRCGGFYEGNIKKALSSYGLAKTTLPAIEKFLEGNVYYLGNLKMWHSTFRYNCQEKAKYLLARNKETKFSQESLERAEQILKCGISRATLKILIAQALDEKA